jgi:transposase-like protein
MAIADVEVQIQRICHHTFQSELQDELDATLRTVALTGIQAALEQALREELRVHLDSHAPGLYRSGYFKRQTDTLYGHLPDLRVPKLRTGNRNREWHILVRYQSALQGLLDRALYAYTLGLSVRDLQELLFLFMGHLFSASAVNRVTIAAQAPMDAWRQQPLRETPPIIIVDGVWVHIQYPTGETWVDKSGHIRRKTRSCERVILAALGVWPDGRHYLLHYEVALAEDATAWAAFWQHLLARQLDAAAVQMVVSDGTKGLLEVLPTYLPQAQLQRCTVHKVRGFERYLRYRDLPTTDAQTGQPLTKEQATEQRRQQMKAEALDIFTAPTQAEAEARLATFEAQWASLEPEALHNFKWGIHRCFTFYQFEPGLHELIRSSNLLERFFREFRNKSDEIGAFPNEESCLTVFHLVMVREHAKHDRVDFAKIG